MFITGRERAWRCNDASTMRAMNPIQMRLFDMPILTPTVKDSERPWRGAAAASGLKRISTRIVLSLTYLAKFNL
ncbi:unnamed protein product [Leptosia nina]|uniref:Uncharacterized protein n=1 Tax=Leptosia nina TaxID=320188 RepID=A0AAV1IUM0_9NEOP